MSFSIVTYDLRARRKVSASSQECASLFRGIAGRRPNGPTRDKCLLLAQELEQEGNQRPRTEECMSRRLAQSLRSIGAILSKRQDNPCRPASGTGHKEAQSFPESSTKEIGGKSK